MRSARASGARGGVGVQDCELFGLDPIAGPPTHFIWTVLPVPPVAIRPSVAMETAVGSNEDDLTIKLMEIVHINNIIKTAMDRGAQIQAIMEDWDFLQLQCAMYINSELPGVPINMQVRRCCPVGPRSDTRRTVSWKVYPVVSDSRTRYARAGMRLRRGYYDRLKASPSAACANASRARRAASAATYPGSVSTFRRARSSRPTPTCASTKSRCPSKSP